MVFAFAALSASEEPEVSLQLRELLHEPSAETRYGAWRALTIADRRDPLVRGEDISDEFKFHVLNTNGPATAVILAVLAVLAVLLGLWFEWKSGWCSGLCPVHPVEKLYGSKPLASFPNAHCHECERCVAVCPDATAGVSPFSGSSTGLQPVAGALMVGGFPGFIWGWFHVPDYTGLEGWHHLPFAYGMPLAGLAATLLTYLLLERILPLRHLRSLRRVFAAAAISCYYWYRLPALFGFGPFPGDGMLLDLRATLPAWFPWVSRIMTTSLFFWWLVGRTGRKRTWLIRPPFAAHPRANIGPPPMCGSAHSNDSRVVGSWAILKASSWRAARADRAHTSRWMS